MIWTIFSVVYFIVILLHIYFAILEMVLWKARAPKLFGLTAQFAADSAMLASNQGLYNLFLVVALLIGFFASDANVARSFTLYGLGCVIVAGIWGGVTSSRRIILVQAVPAALALALYLLH
jgi:putative membrane protein